MTADRLAPNPTHAPPADPARPPAVGGRPDRFGPLATALWVGLVLAVGVKAVASPTRHTVWPIFSTASAHWRAGESLYRHYAGLDMYRYSPAFAVAVAPLAALPDRVGGCLWGVGGLVFVYAALRALHRDVLADRHGPAGRGAFLAVAAVGMAPMAWNLQSNALLLALVAAGTAATARGRWWPAAGLLAAAVMIKVWPLAWVAVVAAGRPRRLGLRFVVALAALAALPALTAPLDAVAHAYREWWDILGAGQGYRWPGYRDLVTAWELTGLPVDPTAYRLLQLAGGGGVLVAAAATTRRTADPRRGLAVGLAAWLCWQLLLGPGSERNTYGLIVPLMGWEVLRARRNGGGWWWPGSALGAVLVFAFGDAERAAARWIPALAAVLPLAVAGFAAWLAVEVARAARPGRAAVRGPWVAGRGRGESVVIRCVNPPHGRGDSRPRTCHTLSGKPDQD